MVTVAISFDSSNEPMVVRLTGEMLDAATLNSATSGQPLRGGTRPAGAYQKPLVGLTWENKLSRGGSIVDVLFNVPEHDLEDVFKGEQEAVTPGIRKVIT